MNEQNTITAFFEQDAGVFMVSMTWPEMPEWVSDWYDYDYYKNSPQKNPIGPVTGEDIVVRVGSWLYVPEFLRSAHRFAAQLTNRHFGYGFRCAKTP